MTCDQAPGARGQWSGLIVNGAASINVGAEAFGEGNTGAYGGTNPADSSGTLKYVRIEFAGIEFSLDNELNGIAFQGVGSGTMVNYVQVHFNQDDGIEFFGGTVGQSTLLGMMTSLEVVRLDSSLSDFQPESIAMDTIIFGNSSESIDAYIKKVSERIKRAQRFDRTANVNKGVTIDVQFVLDIKAI